MFSQVLQVVSASLLLLPSLVASTPTAPYYNVTSGQTNGTSGYVNSLYYANWDIYGVPGLLPQGLPASEITHIIYAFANFEQDGTVFSSDEWADYGIHWDGDSWDDVGNNAYGCVKQLYLLKQANRNLKTLLSIGGYTYRGNFSAAASTDETRSQFASTAVTLMKDWGFDGIDIDWESPTNATDAANFVSLLQAIRSEMDAYAAEYAPGYHFTLTVASPAGASDYGILELSAMAQTIDYFNLMAYDFSGSWSAETAHMANLFYNPENPDATPVYTDASITGYEAAGVPPSKIVLGMPVYGRPFENTEGLGLPYDGVGAATVNYNLLPQTPGAVVYYDAISGATYSYDNTTEELISFDTPGMIKKKVEFLQSRGLAGSMFWEASGDRNDSESLVLASYQTLGKLKSSVNLLSYPNSTYDNIRSGLAASS
ncbi:ThEn42 [Xylariales sp. PMI_506]|nr:ThEn42 [Xylariales sp. PMI_506]